MKWYQRNGCNAHLESRILILLMRLCFDLLREPNDWLELGVMFLLTKYKHALGALHTLNK